MRALMRTIGEVIAALLPDVDDRGVCPDWPPDVFAVAATLADLSGCYAMPRYGEGAVDAAHVAEVRALAAEWAGSARAPERVRTEWAALWAMRDEALGPLRTASMQWTDPVMKLLAVSDESAAQSGFSPAENGRPLVADEASVALKKGDAVVPFVSTLARAVPAEVACVLPKSCVAQVGCSLRTFSRHLALLPSKHVVETLWVPVPEREAPHVASHFTLLAVPAPFRMRPESFAPQPRSRTDLPGRFRVEPTWLVTPGRSPRVEADAIARFLVELVGNAKPSVGTVHGIVLPELALTWGIAKRVADELPKHLPELELFVSGASAAPRGVPHNLVFARRYEHGKPRVTWGQAKHHRWKLDRGQIDAYHLGVQLDRASTWWEDIDIRRRKLHVVELSPRATVAVVVCEDLARHDPVHPVLRSIGPSLVIALLMDGPQLAYRWSSRYAATLADDPGSAVLTLTSAGMLGLSATTSPSEPRQVALFKDATSGTREISLPPGHHALALRLGISADDQMRTADGRSASATVAPRRVQLHTVHAIRHPGSPWPLLGL